MKTRLFLITTLISFGLSAQDSTVVWGEEIRIGKKEKYISIVGMDDDSFYATKNLWGTNKEFVIEKYAKTDLNQTFSETLELPEVGGEDMSFEEIFFLDEKFYLFTSVYDTKANGYRAYCTLMSKDGQWLDLPLELDFMDSRRRENGEFKFELAADSSAFLIHHEFPFIRNSAESFSFKVYKTDLSLLWEKDLDLPYGEEAFEITDYNLDANGNVFLLSGSTQKKQKNPRILEGLRKKKYVLLSYDWKANKLTEFDVSLKDKWIIAVTSGIGPTGDICIGGFYSNNQYFTIAGTFFFSLDTQSKSVKAKGLMAFDKEFLSKFMSEKRVGKGKELPNFYFDHLILHKDGSALMVAEQFDVTQRYTQDPSTGRQIVTNYYNYDDIIAIKVNPNGSIKWATRIPKEQSTTEDLSNYSSYALAEVGDDVHFFFNDNGLNFSLLLEDPESDLYSFTNIKKSVAAHVALNADGLTQRRRLFSHKETETVLRPQLYIKDSNGLIFYAQFRRDYRFGKVIL